MKRPIAAAAGVFAALTIAYGTFSLVSLMARERTVVDVRFDHVEAIQLDLSAGGITLIGGDGDVVTGTRTTVRGLWRPTVTETLRADGTLVLSTKCSSFNGFNCSAGYTLNVPRRLAVRGSTSGGAVTLRDVSGTVDLSSSGGGLRGINLAGDATLSSSGGNVRIERSSAPLTLDSSGGSIRVSDSSGRLKAHSSGGGIEITGSRSRDVTVSSSGGGVRATFVEPPADVDLSSSGGPVHLMLPRTERFYATDASSSGGSTEVQIRTDPASRYRLRLRSSGGDVSVRYPDPTPG